MKPLFLAALILFPLAAVAQNQQPDHPIDPIHQHRETVRETDLQHAVHQYDVINHALASETLPPKAVGSIFGTYDTSMHAVSVPPAPRPYERSKKKSGK